MTDDAPERGVRILEEGIAILDRRHHPESGTWTLARSADEVAAALRGTSRAGPDTHLATLAGLALTARQHAGASAGRATAALRLAGHAIARARPGDPAVRDAVATVLHDVEAAAAADGREVAEAVGRSVARADDVHRARGRRVAEHATALLRDGARVLALPAPETGLHDLVRAAADRGHAYTWVVPEARPDLEGARHTARVLRELHQDVTLITDGGVAAVLHPRSPLGAVDALLTTPRRVTLDGHVVDGVGALGAAVAARAFDVPVLALVRAPEPGSPSVAELLDTGRDGAEVLSVLGRRTASPLVERGHQPAVDVVPPEWVDTVVTDRGPFAPAEVGGYRAALLSPAADPSPR